MVRIGSDRRYEFDVSPAEFWAAASRTDLYRSWWPWLERFDAAALADGDRWTCCVRPPVPYAVNFVIELHDVHKELRVQGRVSGDIEGHARLDIQATASGCRVRLQSRLSPAHPFLKVVALAARPIVEFGHNWVLDTGARQFRASAFTAPMS